MADKNYLSFANTAVGSGQGVPRDLGELIPSAIDGPWSDTLKFSNAWDGDVFSARIVGGLEDCVDMNNGCRNLRVHSPDYTSNGPQVFTVKGGCSDIWLSGIITKPGRVTDVDIDNYSDQSHAASKNIYLNLKRADGQPVRWRSLKGCVPQICNAECRYKRGFFLPYTLGMIWDRFYQFLKWTGISQ